MWRLMVDSSAWRAVLGSCPSAGPRLCATRCVNWLSLCSLADETARCGLAQDQGPLDRIRGGEQGCEMRPRKQEVDHAGRTIVGIRSREIRFAVIDDEDVPWASRNGAPSAGEGAFAGEVHRQLQMINADSRDKGRWILEDDRRDAEVDEESGPERPGRRAHAKFVSRAAELDLDSTGHTVAKSGEATRASGRVDCRVGHGRVLILLLRRSRAPAHSFRSWSRPCDLSRPDPCHPGHVTAI
jgi:hypothetical protein